ncbi:hypothetical protein DPEC_G00085980 [Dallia pectoralis]|uniref:Uncharacterized protein n=1 Tax=Dallia pectoralis TaxID=75939 RepID=A0ACC2H008_DALPE|nr:hypothetical protein DPEC_G00085980 [Dallia pectoralis]
MYCQSVLQQNFTTCPNTTASPTTVSTTPVPTTIRTTGSNSITQPILYTYMIGIELDTTDVTEINTLRASLGNASYPVMVNSLTDITGVDISTAAPNTTASPTTDTTTFGPTTQLTTGTTNSKIPLILYTYMIEIELDTTDVAEINILNTSLGNVPYPVMVNTLTNITGVDISTVCSPNGTGVQCRCENQYRWSCDQCLSYGSCDAITSDTCGCINGIPSDGMYCQSVLQQTSPNTTASPTTDTTTFRPTTQLTTGTTNLKFNMSFRLNEIFTDDLNNPSSFKYQKYKGDIEPVVSTGLNLLLIQCSNN